MFTRLEIKRIDLWSLFKISFILYSVLGLVVGFFMFFFSFLMTGLTSSYYGDELPGMEKLGAALGFLMIPLLAFVYGVIGSVAVTIFGGVFNLVCKVTGGFKVEGEFEGGPPGMPVSPPPPVYHAPPPVSSPPDHNSG